MSKKFLPKSVLALFTFFILFTFSSTAFAATETFVPSEDTYYSYNHKSQSYGGENFLRVEADSQSVDIHKSLLRFDLSLLPEDADITSAFLKLFQTEPAAEGTTIDLGLTHGAWDENTTWNSMPTLIRNNNVLTLDGIKSYKEVEVTTEINSKLTSPDYYSGFYLTPRGSDVDVSTAFYSSEGDRPPILEITYTSESGEDSINLHDPDLFDPNVYDINPDIVNIDITPPILSKIKAKRISLKSVEITWKTNEEATSAVEYGDTMKLTQTEKSNKLVTDHSMVIKGLLPHKIYHFRVRSADKYGNEAVSNTGKFVAWLTVEDPNDSSSGGSPDEPASDDIPVAEDEPANDGQSGEPGSDPGENNGQPAGGSGQNQVDNDQEFHQMSDLVETDFVVVDSASSDNSSGQNSGEPDSVIADASNTQEGRGESFDMVQEEDSSERKGSAVIAKFKAEENKKARVGVLSSAVLTIAAALGLLLVI